MAFLDATSESAALSLSPNRNDAVGLALSALLPLCGLMLAAVVSESAGWDMMNAFPALPLALPGWAGALLILFLFPLWGAARWAAWQAGAEGRAASWWVVGLIGALLAYPFIAAGLDSFFLGWLNLALLLLGVGATARVGAVSNAALCWMLPSVIVLGLAAIQGYVFLTNGWSPGFAVTAALARTDR